MVSVWSGNSDLAIVAHISGLHRLGWHPSLGLIAIFWNRFTRRCQRLL